MNVGTEENALKLEQLAAEINARLHFANEARRLGEIYCQKLESDLQAAKATMPPEQFQELLKQIHYDDFKAKHDSFKKFSRWLDGEIELSDEEVDQCLKKAFDLTF